MSTLNRLHNIKFKNFTTHSTFSVLSFKKNLRNISLSRDISLRLLRSLVRNRPPAENTRSVSTEVGGIVSKDICSWEIAAVFSPPAAKSCTSFIKVSETGFEILLWSRSKDSLLVMLGSETSSRSSEAVTIEDFSVSESNNLTCRLLRFLTIDVLPDNLQES